MSKNSYFCTTCSYEVFKWQGKCPECNEWNTFVDHEELKSTHQIQSKPFEQLVSQTQKEKNRFVTRCHEINRVFGNGITKGSLTLLAGEPGVGKSSLIFRLIQNLDEEIKTLYVTGEETLNQIGSRIKRLDLKANASHFLAEGNINHIVSEIKTLNPEIVIIDSIQTMLNPEILSPAGSVSQVKEVTSILLNELKKKDITGIVIGHISKDGSIAGPKVLEHMVDTVLYFESGGTKGQRTLSPKKNRFGSTEEIALFTMDAKGLLPSNLEEKLKLISSQAPEIGKVFSYSRLNQRSLLFEIETILTPITNTNPKRVCEGISTNRLQLLIAIIEKKLKINLNDYDIYLKAHGEKKDIPKDQDLPIVLTILSSYLSKPIKRISLSSGSLSLTGRITQEKPEVDIPYLKLRSLNDWKELF